MKFIKLFCLLLLLAASAVAQSYYPPEVREGLSRITAYEQVAGSGREQRIWSKEYDSQGRLAMELEYGADRKPMQQEEWRYDDRNRLSSYRRGLGKSWDIFSYEYLENELGQVLEVQLKRNGDVWGELHLTWSEVGILTEEEYIGGKLQKRRRYDVGGNLLNEYSLAEGLLRELKYDEEGRIYETVETNGRGEESKRKKWLYEFNGRCTGFVVNGYKVEYRYNDKGDRELELWFDADGYREKHLRYWYEWKSRPKR